MSSPSRRSFWSCPERDPTRSTGSTSSGSRCRSSAGLVALTYSVIEGPHFGWSSARTIGGIVAAVLVLGLFVRRQLAVDYPILDVRLFSNRYFATAAGMISVAFFALFGFIFLITQYFQAVKGYGPLEAGLWTLPFALVMAVFSPVAMALSHRFGPRPVAITGALLMSAGFAVVEVATPSSGYWSLIIWSMSLMATGLAFISGPCTQLVMDALSPEQAGAGAAVNDTTREVGGTLGVAVLGSILTSVYASGVIDRLTALGVPRDVAQTASESVMAGVQTAARAPGPIAEATRDAVQQVFTDGLRGAVWAAITVTALAAVAAAFLLRGARHSAVDDDDARAVVDPAPPATVDDEDTVRGGLLREVDDHTVQR